MWEKAASQSSRKYQGSPFSIKSRYPRSGILGAILGMQKSLSPGLKLLFHCPKAYRHKGLEKDKLVSSSLSQHNYSWARLPFTNDSISLLQ